jgi:hypothetical protein
MNSEILTSFSSTCKLSTSMLLVLAEITKRASDATWRWVAPDQVRVDVPFHKLSYLYDNKTANLIASFRLAEESDSSH